MKKILNFRLVLPFYVSHGDEKNDAKSIGHAVEVKYELDIDDKTGQIRDKKTKQILIGHTRFVYDGKLDTVEEEYCLYTKVKEEDFSCFERIPWELLDGWKANLREFINSDKEEETFIDSMPHNYLEKLL